MPGFTRLCLSLLVSSAGLVGCETGVRITYYCPDQRTFEVTIRDTLAIVVAGSDSWRLPPTSTASGTRYSDGIRTLKIDSTSADLVLSDSVSYHACTSTPHP